MTSFHKKFFPAALVAICLSTTHSFADPSTAPNQSTSVFTATSTATTATTTTSAPLPAPTSRLSVGVNAGVLGTPNAGILMGYGVQGNFRQNTPLSPRRNRTLSVEAQAVFGDSSAGRFSSNNLQGSINWDALVARHFRPYGGAGATIRQVTTPGTAGYGIAAIGGQGGFQTWDDRLRFQIQAGVGAGVLPAVTRLAFLLGSSVEYIHSCSTSPRCWRILAQYIAVLDLDGRIVHDARISAHIPVALNGVIGISPQVGWIRASGQNDAPFFGVAAEVNFDLLNSPTIPAAQEPAPALPPVSNETAATQSTASSTVSVRRNIGQQLNRLAAQLDGLSNDEVTFANLQGDVAQMQTWVREAREDLQRNRADLRDLEERLQTLVQRASAIALRLDASRQAAQAQPATATPATNDAAAPATEQPQSPADQNATPEAEPAPADNGETQGTETPAPANPSPESGNDNATPAPGTVTP